MLERSLKPHPFRLLLSLEWILISLSALTFLGFDWLFYRELENPDIGLLILNWLKTSILLALFGLMGLRLPRTPLAKVLYLAIAIGLIFPIGYQFPDGISPLLIVLLLRSCLIFHTVGYWCMAGAILLIYLLATSPFLLPFELLPGFVWFLQEIPEQELAVDPPPEIMLEPDLASDLLYWLGSTLTFGLVLLFILLLISSLIRERQGRRQLATAYEKLYQYSRQIEDQATLNERIRIARDIHDSLGHLLTTQSVLLQNAELSLLTNPEEVSTFLGQSRQISTDALEELRQSVWLLRADVLQGRSLDVALASLLNEFHRTTGIAPTFEMSIETRLSKALQVAVYRIIEESLTNIRKYSAATQVSIRLNDNPGSMQPDSWSIESITDTDRLVLQIEDNGTGFHIEQNATGFGIQGMQERTTSLGGHFQIFSQPGAGCRVTAIFPLSRNVV